MTFTTLTYFVFLALTFALYWSRQSQVVRNVILLIASCIFYAWWDWRFLGLLLGSGLLDFFVAIRISESDAGVKRKSLVALSMIVNLSVLGFFKYFNFFAEQLVVAANSVGWEVGPILVDVILPVGISFYTFQTMSYTLDVYYRELEPSRRLTDYLAYVSFFPQLVAGPIERGKSLLPQLIYPTKFDRADAEDGCRLILWGMFKKMVIADNLAVYADAVYADPSGISGTQAVMGTFAFAFQIYCDFSGYSDIAIGTARLFGIKLMRNFAYPYFSQSLGEFWRRWHISLSSWFRDYLYLPLGGSRRGRWAAARNVLITFVVSGLWHGASWNFIIWGAIHGIAVLPNVLFRGSAKRITSIDAPGPARGQSTAAALVRMAAVFVVSAAGWVFFRAATLHDAMLVFGSLTQWSEPIAEARALLAGSSPQTLLGAALTPAFVFVEWLGRRHWHPLALSGRSVAVRWAVYMGLLWTVLYLGTRNSGAFIYFQF